MPGWTLPIGAMQVERQALLAVEAPGRRHMQQRGIGERRQPMRRGFVI
jgi:hypothetical protein